MVFQILERFHSFPPIGCSTESCVLKTVAHIISCRHGRENDTYHIVYSCVQIVYSVLCIVYCSGKEVAAVPPHLALVAGSTL